ncbi:MAG: PKD domain-containing protein [Saprospiraceae bacterium]|nr:PKD domain-containing protein [Saprospiraceae bacterium]
MKNIIKGLCSLLAITVLFTACDPLEDIVPEIGDRPTADDVTFDFEYDAQNPNIVHFSNTSEGFILQWDLGNGASAEGQTATGIYPLAGEYTVTLKAFTKAGSAENSTTITIDQTDPS